MRLREVRHLSIVTQLVKGQGLGWGGSVGGLGSRLSPGERQSEHLDSKSRMLQAPPIPGETQASKCEAPVLVTWEEEGAERESSLICIKTLIPPVSWALSIGPPGTGP